MCVESFGCGCGRSVSLLIELLTGKSSMAGRIGGGQARGRGCVFLALLLRASRSRLVDDTFIDIRVGLVERLNLGLARR
jgi:hypothetical protein